MIQKIALNCLVVSMCLIKSVSAQECKILRVGGVNGWLPVSYFNKKTQKAEGIANDLLHIISTKLNTPLTINVELPWKRALVYLNRGELDLISAIYWTKEREQLYQYTIPYFTNEARIFVLKGKEFPFENLDDLIGRTGGITSGGSFGEAFDTFAKEHKLILEGVTTSKQQVKKLLRGRIDYLIQDYFDGTMNLKLSGLQNKIVPLAHPVSITKVYFVISRQSPCMKLVPKINDIINQAQEDGTLQTIIDKYIQK